MKLPIPQLFGKKEASNYFLSLLLRDEKVVAVILQEVDGQLKIVGQSQSSLSSPLEKIPFEELLELLDKVISRAEETLPPNVETEKTVFGVKDSWVEEKKIKKDFLATLKKLCDALSLQPIGFMVVSEAVSHLLSQEEGAPLSAVLAEVNKSHITLSLFRAGKVIESHTASIEDGLLKTVDRLLHHFTVDVLPSRLIIFNGGEAEQLAQEFISHQWSKSIPFLHVPQISVLPEGFDGKAMVYGAGEQMGFSVIDTLGDIKAITVTPPEAKKSESEKTHDEKEVEKVEEKITSDKASAEDTPSTAKTDSPAQDTLVPADNFGFVVGQDITTLTPHLHKKEADETDSFSINRHSEDITEVKPSTAFHENPSQNDSSSSSPVKKIMSSIISFFTQLPFPFKGGSFPSLPLGRNLLIILLIPLLIIGLGVWYYLSLEATVTLHMQSKKIEERTGITLAVDSRNDLSQKVLAAREVETSQDGTVSISTTGTKDVGEKAKGTVTLYNNSEAKKTVPAGTVITSSNDLDFVTDKDVVVASASGDIFSGTKPGTTDVAVTAKSIGTEYNLPSNTKFEVTGINGVAGKNDGAFSGGTKKQVKVVAKKDIDTLSSQLTKSLEEKAKNTLLDKSSGEKSIIPTFTDVSIAKKNLDFDIGDEASKVTMKGTVVFTTLEYTTADLKELAEATLQGEYNQDLAISDKGITAELEDIQVNDDEITAQLLMSAGLLPKLDKESISSEITGKSFTDATSYLSTIPQVSSASIEFSPSIPLIPKILPRMDKNITVILESDE